MLSDLFAVEIIPRPFPQDRVRASGTHMGGPPLHVIPAKAGIHYYEEARGRWLAPSCRWHSPGLGITHLFGIFYIP